MTLLKSILLAFTLFLFAAGPSEAAEPYRMATGDYLETFDTIATWEDDFESPRKAIHWGSVPINASGTIPDGIRITTGTATFVSPTFSGVQRGSSNIVLLANPNNRDNPSATAIDLYLNFTGQVAGTLSFDYEKINNGSGSKAASLRVYTSTNGVNWTELTAAAALNLVNNGPAQSGPITTVPLPDSFSNSPTARVRFYVHTGTGLSVNLGPRIAIDNVSVTSLAVSTNANLFALSLSPDVFSSGTFMPAFASNTVSYTASVANATAQVTVTPTSADATATIQVRINGGGFVGVNSGSPSSALALNVGANPIDVRVTAQDGTTLKTYTLTVTRAEPGIFTYVPITGLPGVSYGSAAWGDYDNDGRLDILLTGDTGSGFISQVWRNTGSGFTNINAALPGVDRGSVAWGDYDNDGRLDILLTGDTGTEFISEVWRNTGGGFTNINAGLPGCERGSAAWGDYDNDGRLDILLTGETGTDAIFQVWRNTGNGFTNINAGLPGVSYGSAAWGDYDNDGRLDILLTGDTGSGFISQVWRNTGSGFTNINAALPGVDRGSVAWGDYDNDGSLDILLTGYTGAEFISQVWRNTGSGFTNSNAGLPGRESSSVAWGDYDNDGRLDILLTGYTGTDSHVWRNTGSGFTNINAGLPRDSEVSAVWGDYDNDGRLDILVTGYRSPFGISQVWRNTTPTPNAPPTPPSGLAVGISGSTATLSWNPSLDAQTPAAGLNYNVRIGTTPGGSTIVAPQALADGTRLVPQMGHARAPSAHYHLPPGGTYYWSVQAVDTSFAGSPFAAERQFITQPLLINPIRYPNGVFEFQFTNQTVLNFEVLASTNVGLPLTNWTSLGLATPLGTGLYRFTDAGAPGHSQRFYMLRAP